MGDVHKHDLTGDDTNCAICNDRERLREVEAQLTAAQEEVKRYKEALEAIRGPTDSGPLIDVYRRAGGGYEGLQAIARKGLGE